MSRREDIENDIWDDPDFAELSKDATLLFIWSWTNTRCNMSGVYKVPMSRMTESKVASEVLPAALEELAAARFVFYEDGVLWVRSRTKRHRTRTEQMAKSVVGDIAKLAPDHPIRVRFLAEYGREPWLRPGFERHSLNPRATLTKVPEKTGGSVTVTPPSSEGVWKETGKELTAVEEGKGGVGGKETQKAKTKLPAGFPDELRPHLRAVYVALSSLAERHNANAVNVVALANLFVDPGNRHKPFVKAAHECAAHWDDGHQVRRVVAAYRNWLDRSADLAGIERIGPAAASTVPRVQSSGRRPNASEMLVAINSNSDDSLLGGSA